MEPSVSAKSGYTARLEGNKPVKNIANLGIKKGQRAEIRRNGEYNGLVIEALADLRPLLTDFNVNQALTALATDDVDRAVRSLGLSTEFVKYGADVIHYVITRWFQQNDLEAELPDVVVRGVDIGAGDGSGIGADVALTRWIETVRNDPLPIPFKVVSPGRSKKGHPVVPESWVGREFRDGNDFHRAMDGLAWRRGLPPVTYCCTHGMVHVDEVIWTMGPTVVGVGVSGYILRMGLQDGHLATSITATATVAVDEIPIPEGFMYTTVRYNQDTVITLVVDQALFEPLNGHTRKTKSVGVLASTLQKCIRRGPVCADLLAGTIARLNDSPNYILPDQQFARVSGTRQLLWRSFISIVEDATPYRKSDSELDLLDIISLALVCHRDPGLRLREPCLGQLTRTMCSVQRHDGICPWRDAEWVDVRRLEPICDDDPTTRTVDALLVALSQMPMMYGDRIMLTKCVDLLGNTSFRLPTLTEPLVMERPKAVGTERDARLASHDMHCHPNMLLSLQARLPFINPEYTTQYLSRFIWEHSSCVNFRDPSTKTDPESLTEQARQTRAVLRYLQARFDVPVLEDRLPTDFLSRYGPAEAPAGAPAEAPAAAPAGAPAEAPASPLDNETSRVGFLLLFGKRYKLKNSDVIIAGSVEEPCRIKKKSVYLTGKERCKLEKEFIEQFAETIVVPSPPQGTRWRHLTVGRKVCIGASLCVPTRSTRSTRSGNDPDETPRNTVQFTVTTETDCFKLAPFDARPLLENCPAPLSQPIDNPSILDLCLEGLHLLHLRHDRHNVVDRLIYYGQLRRDTNDHRLYDWVDYARQSSIPAEVWRQFYAKLAMNLALTSGTPVCTVNLGPVDRSGNKTQNAVSYRYEGVFIRLMCLMTLLYPRVVEYISDIKFRIRLDDPGALHLLESLRSMIGMQTTTPTTATLNPQCETVTVKTTLWDHQKKTVETIFAGMKRGRLGYGDASHVGMGKTLTALGLMQKLVTCPGTLTPWGGFLVLVPTEILYKTWQDEILKHTEGFDVALQTANGELESTEGEPVTITPTTILISTMGRMRDHPLSVPWLLTVIDECLTVQNKEALQTEEAWRQVLVSKYGVLMMSATFFRSRFDKMFHMLKMLRSNLPETPEYLDTILSETMVCNITEGQRIWTTRINRSSLTAEQSGAYETVLRNNLRRGHEKTYHALVNFVNNECDYVSYFDASLRRIVGEDPQRKILIYARSRDEADEIASRLKDNGVGRYPDKSRQHTVVSFAEGTFGLNDLVIYDTILTRIPNPDVVPQMKGRLDRPGNAHTRLYLEYLLLSETIEEASLYKLEMANSFNKKFILPLAEFYKIALNPSGKTACDATKPVEGAVGL